MRPGIWAGFLGRYGVTLPAKGSTCGWRSPSPEDASCEVGTPSIFSFIPQPFPSLQSSFFFITPVLKNHLHSIHQKVHFPDPVHAPTHFPPTLRGWVSLTVATNGVHLPKWHSTMRDACSERQLGVFGELGLMQVLSLMRYRWLPNPQQ